MSFFFRWFFYEQVIVYYFSVYLLFFMGPKMVSFTVCDEITTKHSSKSHLFNFLEVIHHVMSHSFTKDRFFEKHHKGHFSFSFVIMLTSQ